MSTPSDTQTEHSNAKEGDKGPPDQYRNRRVVLTAENSRIHVILFSLWPFPIAVFPREQHAVRGMETRLPQFLLYIKWSSQQLWLQAAFLLVKSWLSSVLFSGEQKFFDPRAERPLPRISSTLPLCQVLSLLLVTLTYVINCSWAQACLWLVSRGSEWNTFTWQLKLPLIFCY